MDISKSKQNLNNKYNYFFKSMITSICSLYFNKQKYEKIIKMNNENINRFNNENNNNENNNNENITNKIIRYTSSDIYKYYNTIKNNTSPMFKSYTYMYMYNYTQKLYKAFTNEQKKRDNIIELSKQESMILKEMLSIYNHLDNSVIYKQISLLHKMQYTYTKKYDNIFYSNNNNNDNINKISNKITNNLNNKQYEKLYSKIQNNKIKDNLNNLIAQKHNYHNQNNMLKIYGGVDNNKDNTDVNDEYTFININTHGCISIVEEENNKFDDSDNVIQFSVLHNLYGWSDVVHDTEDNKIHIDGVNNNINNGYKNIDDLLDLSTLENLSSYINNYYIQRSEITYQHHLVNKNIDFKDSSQICSNCFNPVLYSSLKDKKNIYKY